MLPQQVVQLLSLVRELRSCKLCESESESCSVMSDSLQPHGLYSPWNSPGQNTGVGSLSLLQGIFPTQGVNPGLPHCRQILYQLSPKGSPRILEWVAYPFSSGFSQPRDQAQVSTLQADASPAEPPGKPEVHIKGVISVDPDFRLPIQRKELNFLT